MQKKEALLPSVFITGAKSGLGKVTAEHFLSLGARVFAADIDNCDVTNFSTVSKFVDSLPEIPRIWVNCAGVVHAKRVIKMSPDEFKNIININLIGTFNVIKCAVNKLSSLEEIQNGERGVIINTASIASSEGQVGQVAYSASKAGVVGMTLPLARELASLGIRVVTIAPGVMDTPMSNQISEAVKNNLINNVPFPKRLGKPQEFALLVQHIVENHYLNGEVIRLDGALRMAAI
ncbi:MAG: SDR family NAD(P)-dependent oxidoreductase [Gammaproteobacteria bacterium]|nr:SDR family NAD(P)-dependent oxidoreductase [Gammaproteobacteria bacterium]